ncbi:SpoIIE family protein phosphatase [Herbidospora sp. RD11066]
MTGPSAERFEEPPAAMRAVLAAGGAMGGMIAAHDWAGSPIGPMAEWPQSLRSAVGLCLVSRFPCFVFWGPELIQLTNDAFIPVLGSKHPAALGRPAREVWSETWDLVGPMLAGVVADRESAFFEDLPVLLERGRFAEECYFTFCYSPIITETGEVGGVFATVTETTGEVVGARRTAVQAELSERTRTAGSAAEACERAAQVFARHPVDVPFALLYLLDGDQAVLAAAAGLTSDDGFSWPLDEARDGPVEVDCPPDPRLGRMARDQFPPPSQAVILPITAAERPAGFLVAGIDPGRPLDADYRTFLQLLTGQIAAAITDASALDAARHRAERLAALDRAKTTFFANVSHELRTPLTLMLGPLEGLLADPDTPEREQVEMIHRNALRLLRHVNTLLDVTSGDHADQLRFEPVDLAAYTAELGALFGPALEHGGVALVLDCRPLPEPVWVDRQAWDKIVLNLLSNAFKFTLSGRITLTVDVHDGHARLRVTDTGVGIPAEELPLIFDRFHRVEDGASRSVEGSGIGLSLVRDLLHRHEGTIEVTSEPGLGSTFTALLPFRTPASSPAPIAPAHDEPGAAAYVTEAFGWVDGAVPPDDSADPIEVLVVDDNADMRALLVRALSPHWRVRAVGDGQAALETALRRPPELILTDVMMPRLDGFGLLKALRQHPATSDVPVVMVSARAGTEAIIEGLDEGADDYLVKPFTTAELLARVRTQLTTARQRRAAATRIRLLGDITHQLNTGLEPVAIAATLARHLTPAYGEAISVWLHEKTPGSTRRFLHRTGATHPGDRLTLPLNHGGEQIGAVELSGLTSAARAQLERPFLTEVVDRAAAALGNATRFEHEHDTALNLQTAMLTDLPDVPGLTMAALYQPAAAKDLVGGDWYDAFLIPSADLSLAVTIGDITGHDIHAAALMGQLRNMLRQAVLDHPGQGPAAAVTALEYACDNLPITASGTLVQGQLDRDPSGSWTFTWTNAGHPRPLLLHPDGTVDQLLEYGLLIFPKLHPNPRTDHRRPLPPGSTLLLYSDGLIDRPGSDVDHDIALAMRLLADHQDRPLDELLHTLATRIPGPHPTDDIALLAVRIP